MTARDVHWRYARCAFLLLLASCGRLGFDAGDDDANLPDLGTSEECAGTLADAALCDGFDQGIGSSWSPVVYGDSVCTYGAVSDRKNRGSQSAHFDLSSAVGTGHGCSIKHPVPVPAGESRWFRLMVFFPEPVHSYGVFLHFNTSGGTLQIGSTMGHLFAGTFDIAQPTTQVLAPAAFERNRWHCISGEVLANSKPSGRFTLSDDGVEVVRQEGVNLVGRNGSGFDSISVGLPWADSAGQLWLDEIVVDTQPIPCP